MRSSVILCTYNGEPFIRSQLESLLAQTRPIDEIALLDDQSSDKTVSIAEEFRDRIPALQICLNERNFGCVANFAKGIAVATGDVLFFCDQDDIWEKNKVERICQLFEKCPEIGYVFTNAERIDEQGQTLLPPLWDAIAADFSKPVQQEFEETGGFSVLLRGYYLTGCTMAFRAEFRDLILPIPSGWMHDAWVGLCLSAVSRGFPMNEQLVKYRNHADQLIGEYRRSLLAQYQQARQMGSKTFEERFSAFAVLSERLQGQSRWNVADEKLRLLDQKLQFQSARCELRRRRFRLPLVLKQYAAGNYGRFSEGLKAVCQDLMLP